MILVVGQRYLAATGQPDEEETPREVSDEPDAPLDAAKRMRILIAVGFAMLLYTIAYGQLDGMLLLWARDHTDRSLSSGPTSPLWLLGCLTLLVLGELLIAPLALALMTRMAPRRLVGLMSGLWCASSAAGYCIAGEVGVLLQRGQSGRSFAILGGVLVLGAACVAAIASISRNEVKKRPRP